MAKSYDNASLSDQIIVNPDGEPQLGHALGVLGNIVGSQVMAIRDTFDVKVTEIRLDHDSGVEVTIKL